LNDPKFLQPEPILEICQHLAIPDQENGYRVAKLLYYSSLLFIFRKKSVILNKKKLMSFEKDGLMLIYQKVDARNRLSNLDGIEVFSIVIRRVVNVMPIIFVVVLRMSTALG
jgi:hypothetical protein